MSAAIQQEQPVTLPLEVIEEIEHDRDQVLQMSQGLVIETDADFDNAGEFLKAIRAKKKAIYDRISINVSLANAAHKAATKLRNELTAPAVHAEEAVKSSMKAYVDKREAEAAEQRRIQADIDRKREEEERELARKLQAEEDERLAKAAELEAEGKADEAEVLLEMATAPSPEPAPVPAPRPIIKAPKTSGASIRKVWSMRVDDENLLVGAWLKGDVPRDVVAINEGALNRIAKSLKESARIPGCRPVSENAIAGR